MKTRIIFHGTLLAVWDEKKRIDIGDTLIVNDTPWVITGTNFLSADHPDDEQQDAHVRCLLRDELINGVITGGRLAKPWPVEETIR